MSVTVSNSTGGLAAPFLGRVASLVGVPNLQAAQTLAIRVRWTVTTTTGNPLLIWVNDGTLAGMYIGRFAGSGASAVDFVRVSTGGTGNNAQTSVGYGSTSAWVHLCMVYDATNIIAYVNGAQAATIASTPAFLPNQLPTQMACGGMGEAEMTDACFFNRALSAAEVAILAAGRDAPYKLAGCYSFFPMHAQTSALADCGLDYGASKNNCTLQLSGTGNPASSNGAPPTPWGVGRTDIILPTAVAISATGTTNTTGTAALTAAAGLVASGLTQTTGTAAMTAAAALAASGLTQTTGSATVTASAGLVASGLTRTSGSATMSGALTATGVTQTTGAATMTAAASIAASGLTQTTGSATMTATASLVASGVTQTTGSAAFAGAAVPDAPDASILLDGGAGGVYFPLHRGRPWLYYTPFQPITYRSILGDKLLDYWHSEQDIALDGSANVQTWTGQVRGFVLGQTLGAGQRPLYGSDAAFGGRNVVQCRIAGLRCLAYKPGVPIFTPGDRPGLVHVSRYVTAPTAAASTTLVNMGAATAPTPPAIFVNDFFDGSQVGTNLRRAVIRTTGHFTPFGLTVFSDPPITTTPSMRALGLTATQLTAYTNGQLIGSVENNENLSEPFDQLNIGAQSEVGSTPSDSNFAMVFLLRNMCTQFEALQLYTLAKAEWSLP